MLKWILIALLVAAVASLLGLTVGFSDSDGDA